MADLTSIEEDDYKAGDNFADRAQVFLIGGLALALALVALALVLNSAVYTENFATRGSDGAGIDATFQVKADVQQGVGDLVAQSNRGYTDYSDQVIAIQAGIPTLETLYMRYAASDGRRLRLSYVAGSEARGISIRQNAVELFKADADGNLTADSTWTLIEQTPAVRSFQLTIPNRTTLAGARADAFRIVLDPEATKVGDEWTVLLYNDSGVSVIAVDGPSGAYGECRDSTAAETTVDITRATVDGERCPALEFLNEVQTDFDIRYEHADNATGTFQVVGKVGPSTSVPTAPYLSGNPSASDAVYGVTIHLFVQTSTITYETNVRVAPGEQDV